MASVSCGIVGLPNSGKSTLFNALLKRQIAQVAQYPYTTIEPNVGVVEVPDERLTQLADVIAGDPSTPLATNRPQVVPAAIRFIDIAGLIKGAHQGEGLGNQFLAHIREVDAIVHVVRAFVNSNVPHVAGKIDPASDIEVVSAELEAAGIKKPTIYVLNIAEADLGSTSLIRISEVIERTYGGGVVRICAKLEAELADLSAEDQKAYLRELGVEKSSLDQIITQSYKLLDLITFLTIAGGKSASAEASARPRLVQAWPVKAGTEMIEAAGMVHTDFAKNFIKAEIIPWDKLVEVGSWTAAREKGWLKIAGRDEEVRDGEVIEFKFSV